MNNFSGFLRSVYCAAFVTVSWIVLDKSIGNAFFGIDTHDYTFLFVVAFSGAIIHSLFFGLGE
jgi:hypothetical protein